MSLLDEWNKVKNKENSKESTKKWALGQGAPKTQSSYFPNNGRSNVSSGIMNPESGQAIAERAAKSSPRSGGRNILPPGWRERNAQITAEQERQSLMQGLMDRIGSTYEPIMPGPADPNQPNPNDAIMARITGELDRALAARLGAIGNVRNQAQEGFNTSDANLKAMFDANANNIATQGSQRFQQIGQDYSQGINATRDESLNRLAADRNNAMAQRAAMLKSLGIEAAGAQADPGEQTLNDAMTGITNRSNIASQGAEQMNATNQAFNQSVVNSVNQQGTERRAALLQQLQAIQNELGMAEAEAQNQDAQQRSQLEIQRMQAEAEAQANSQPSFDDLNKFGYQQFRDDRDLAFDLWKNLTAQEQQGMEQQEPTRVQGYAGLGQDLINQGIPEAQVGQYMAALSQVIGGEYMQGIHPDEGYDRASIISRRLQEMNIPAPIATHLATNYANLGNNSYFNG